VNGLRFGHGIAMALVLTFPVGCQTANGDPPNQTPPPATAVPPDLRAVCERIAATVREIGLQGELTEGRVGHALSERTRVGCRVVAGAPTSTIVGRVEPDTTIRSRLSQDGWKEDLAYAADGPGAAAFAFRMEGTLCVFSLGAPSHLEDGEFITSDRYEFDVRCVVEPSTVPAAAPNRRGLPEADSETGPTPLRSRIPTPAGFDRLPVGPGSFGAWLRELPVRPGRPAVRLHDGRPKVNQDAHFAVLDVDVGSKDLQQCADAVIRLRSEFLFAGPCADEIAFDFTSGDTARWTQWREGTRPRVSGNRVAWSREAEPDGSYANFREYLETVFTYAGSASLERELLAVGDPSRPELGDVFIEGGFPGHAVLVLDVAVNPAGERVFLLAQSYMPAQDIHVLKSFDRRNPWYPARSDGVLSTPEWDFHYRQLRRFPYTECERSGGQISD
jgi:hypothetical protein